VGFCPYGPRCHFVHALDEVRNAPAQSPDNKKQAGGPVKQLPMFGRNGGDSWSFNNDNNKPDMRSAVAQLDKYFNMSSNRPFLNSSNDSSRSGSFCSDAESLPSSSPPRESFCASPNDDPSNLRLPIFSRFA